MDILLGIVTTVFIFLLLLYAAIRDYQRKEVSNGVWIVGIFVLPLTLFRVVIVGLWFLYSLQVLLVFVLVIGGFQLGVLGGADGKAVLLISLIYPWIKLEPLWLALAPVTVLIGAFLLVGFHSLRLLLGNLLVWKRNSKNQDPMQKPEKKFYWLTRTLVILPSQSNEWKEVDVPLIVYLFIIYMLLLILIGLLQ